MWLPDSPRGLTSLSRSLSRAFRLAEGGTLLPVCLTMITVRTPVGALFGVPLATGYCCSRPPHGRGTACDGDAYRWRDSRLVVFLFPRFEALSEPRTKTQQHRLLPQLLATANTDSAGGARSTTSRPLRTTAELAASRDVRPCRGSSLRPQLAGAADRLAWWFILFWAVRGFESVPSPGRAGRLVLLVPAAALVGVLALTLANYGILIRMRAMDCRSACAICGHRPC